MKSNYLVSWLAIRGKHNLYRFFTLALVVSFLAMAASASSVQGYWLVDSAGGVFAFGDASYLGSTAGVTLAKPIVGMEATPDGNGYWLVASDGGVFAYGDASFHGSTGGTSISSPIVGMEATPDGKGYWLVSSAGGIYAFGDASFLGSTGGVTLSSPIVGMEATPDGNGYWLVASAGGIFAFGDASFHGSTGGTSQSYPIVGIEGDDAARSSVPEPSTLGLLAAGLAALIARRLRIPAKRRFRRERAEIAPASAPPVIVSIGGSMSNTETIGIR